jgi:alpha-tubulin suppressor-like RCC1 family protein
MPCKLTFIPVTDKTNPAPILFGAIPGPGDTHEALAPLIRSFQTDFIQQVPSLALANNINQFNYVVDDKYNIGESNSQDDDYLLNFQSAPTPNAFANAISSKLAAIGSTLTAQDIVARAETQSCAGCHSVSQFSQLNAGSLGGGLSWPQSFGFVHVFEEPTEISPDGPAGARRFPLSPAMTTEFLPHRLDIMRNFLANPAKVTAVAAGTHTCAIKNGALECWGANASGQLGNGTTTNSTTPVLVSGLTSGVTAVSVGGFYTCAIKSGALTCWGKVPGGATRNTPVLVGGLSSGVTAVATGGQHVCAIQSGALKCFGTGPLGNGTTTNSTTPVQVSSMKSGVTAVAAGGQHVCAIRSGALKCWGFNADGQVGGGSPGAIISTPVQVTGMTSGVTAVAADSSQTCAVQNGALKCWGYNGFGGLGNGTMTSSTAPVQVTSMTSGVTAVAVTARHTCAVQSGGVKCWGVNENGQLGNGTTTNSTTPVPVTGMTSGVTAVETGNEYTCAIQGGTALKCWGFNENGQLGNGTQTGSKTPVQVMGMP